MSPVFVVIFNRKEVLFWLKFWNTCLIVLLFSPRFQRKCNFFSCLKFRWKSNGYVGENLKRLAIVYVYFFTLEFSTGRVNVIKEKLFLSRAILNSSKNFTYRVNWWILKGESRHWQANILYLKTHTPVMITWNLKYCVRLFQLNRLTCSFVTILAAFHFRHVIVSWIQSIKNASIGIVALFFSS